MASADWTLLPERTHHDVNLMPASIILPIHPYTTERAPHAIDNRIVGNICDTEKPMFERRLCEVWVKGNALSRVAMLSNSEPPAIAYVTRMGRHWKKS